MYRSAIEDLKKWKNSKSRKPLMLMGARQVGKTWLLKEFGRSEYKNVVYASLENNPRTDELFSFDMDTARIIDGLASLSGETITPSDTLIILDEIQENPNALASLKYFCENAPEYDIAVAGSLLGLALHEGTSFPVGKIDIKHIYPMTFAEFLYAIDKPRYAELLKSPDAKKIAPFHTTLLNYLKTYYITGGMPAVIQNYLDEGNLLGVRDIQSAILTTYGNDFSKHAPGNLVPRIREVFNILPAQLAKENKKFVFNMIRSGARAKDYETAIMWLEDASIVSRVCRTNSPNIPTSVYINRDIFKLFCLDVGLLGAMANVLPQTILDGNEFFKELKGAMAEQFVCQELIASGQIPYYYSKDDSHGEIDFLLSQASSVLPIEVKSGSNLGSASLNAFLKRYPGVPFAAKISTLPLKLDNEKILNLPLYLTSELTSLLPPPSTAK